MTITVFASLGALLVWTGWFASRDRAVVLRQLWLALGVEVLFIAQAILIAIQLATGYKNSEPATLWGYILTTLILLPLAGLLAFAERTRWSSVVLCAATVACLVLQWRLIEIWGS